jgi:hypothetical protein
MLPAGAFSSRSMISSPLGNTGRTIVARSS